MPPNEASWKLAEYERHFNTIQGGLRGIASIWLLAAFGAIASVLTHDDTRVLTVPSELAIAAVSAMGSIGLALLWTQDELIYHRLLNAIFVVGLRLEASNNQLPPIHAAMYATMPSKGYEHKLAHFYNVPIAVLGVASIAALFSDVYGSGLEFSAIAILTLTAIPSGLFAFIRANSDDEVTFFADQAKRYGKPFSDFFSDVADKPRTLDSRRFDDVLAHYCSSDVPDMSSETPLGQSPSS